ncbi:MAG: GtrA family protein [Bacteroidaceae bacterium]|nr:GtrA family protein [Bacteroidaceae bacterium]
MGKIKEFITGKRQQIVQFIRFCIVGTVAAGIHYGIYYVLLRVGAGHNLAYATGYIISFVCNFIATSYFTFRSSPSWGRFAGFAGSHAINFLLHMTLLNVFLWIGMHELIAPIAVMLVAMLVQYAILNLVFRKK